MSFLERKKKRELMSATSVAWQEKETKLQDIAIHPLVKGKCSRDVCDAYFQGLVCAAFADNETLDTSERLILNDIGESLGMLPRDVDEVEQAVQTIVNDIDKFESLIKECLLAIKDDETAVKLFYAQFAQIWISQEHESKDALGDTLAAIGASNVTGVALPNETLTLILTVLDGGDGLGANLLSLSEWMGEDALKHFAAKQYGDVSALLKNARKQKEVEAEAKRKADALKAEADKVKAFYEKMRNFVAKYIDKKSVTREFLFDMGDELADAGFDKIDPQAAFKEVAVQMLNRVEALSLPEIFNGDLPRFHRDVCKIDGSDLTEDERNKFNETELIAKETVWILIGLCGLMFKNEDLSIENVNKVILQAQMGIKFDSDMVDLWAKNTVGGKHGGTLTSAVLGVYESKSIEDVFLEALGVKSVWESLFVATDAQWKMLDDWAERRGRRYGGDKLKQYARSIGISWIRWCDDTTFRKKIESVVLKKAPLN